jgi:hypothetical protein
VLQLVLVQRRADNQGCIDPCHNSKKSEGSRIRWVQTEEATPQKPYTKSFDEISQYVTGCRLLNKECRQGQIKLRLHLALCKERDVQLALQVAGSKDFKPYVLKAAELRIAQHHSPSEAYSRWIVRSAMPGCGVKPRKSNSKHISEHDGEKCHRVQCDVMDHFIYLTFTAPVEKLAEYVQRPTEFCNPETRKTIPVVALDQSGVWALLHGEEKVLLAKGEVQYHAETQRLKRWQKSATTPAELQVVEAVLAQHEEGLWSGSKRQIDQQMAQGGDKLRNTLTNFMVIENLGSNQPTGTRSIKTIWLVRAKGHVRLSDISIDAPARWIRDVKVLDALGAVLLHKEGELCPGVLTVYWVFRNQYPGHPFFDFYDVWGQHSATADQQICAWQSDHVAEQFPQGALLLMDTLGSQWTEKTMTRYFLNNQLAAPVVPGTTSELSPPDVGLHAFQKQVIRQGNIDIQAHAGVEPGSD